MESSTHCRLSDGCVAYSVDTPSDQVVWKAVVMKASYSDTVEVRATSTAMDIYINGIHHEANKSISQFHKGLHWNAILNLFCLVVGFLKYVFWNSQHLSLLAIPFHVLLCTGCLVKIIYSVQFRLN